MNFSRLYVFLLFFPVSIYGQSSASPSRSYLRAATIVSMPSTENFYPSEAIKAGRQGVVTLRTCIDHESKITSVQVVTSSGHSDLDEAAVALSKQGVYTAKQSMEDGKPSAACVSFRVKFEVDAGEYVGGLRDGERDGDGSVAFADGRRYVGKFRSNKFNGFGRMVLPNGTSFEGIWEDDSFVEGALSLPDGSKLTGRWQDGELNGQGTFTSSDFSYVGEYRSGKASGWGTNVWANGDKYVGEFRDDTKSGQGMFTWADGGRYVGEFQDDYPNGQGSLLHPNGTRYFGEWRDGKYNGEGFLVLPSGERYVGQFLAGTRHGSGRSILPDGSTFEADWVNDSLVTRSDTRATIVTNEKNSIPNSNQVTIDAVRECVRNGFKPGSAQFTRCITER